MICFLFVLLTGSIPIFFVLQIDEVADMTLAELKQKGNEHFKLNQFEEALSCYTKALDLSDQTTNTDDRAVLHKNMSACHLKLNNPDSAVLEASRGIHNHLYRITLSDIKRLDDFISSSQCY